MLQYLMQNAGVFFSESAVLEFRVGDGVAVLCRLFSVVNSIEAFWMLNHHIEPDVGLYLTQNVRMCARGDALNRRFNFTKRLEKGDYAFRDTNLLALLVNVHV